MAKEYIEREEAIQYFKERSKDFIGHEPIPPALVIMGCANEVDAIPAADVAPVVRCKNCLRWKRDAYGGVCDRYGVRLNEEWFCAGGEWREVDDED